MHNLNLGFYQLLKYVFYNIASIVYCNSPQSQIFTASVSSAIFRYFLVERKFCQNNQYLNNKQEFVFFIFIIKWIFHSKIFQEVCVRFDFSTQFLDFLFFIFICSNNLNLEKKCQIFFNKYKQPNWAGQHTDEMH